MLIDITQHIAAVHVNIILVTEYIYTMDYLFILQSNLIMVRIEYCTVHSVF